MAVLLASSSSLLQPHAAAARGGAAQEAIGVLGEHDRDLFGPEARAKRGPFMRRVDPRFVGRRGPIYSSVSIGVEGANGSRMRLDRQTLENDSIVRTFAIDSPVHLVSLEPGEE